MNAPNQGTNTSSTAKAQRSAAGIVQSNLGGEEQRTYAAQANREAFEQALGAPVADEFAIYERVQAQSLAQLAA